jgi:hypothetical protein
LRVEEFSNEAGSKWNSGYYVSDQNCTNYDRFCDRGHVTGNTTYPFHYLIILAVFVVPKVKKINQITTGS